MRRKTLLIITAIILLLSLSVQAAHVHRINPGENIYTIAADYGVTVGEIVNLNNLLNPGEVYSKQVLIIPDVNQPGTYRIKTSDTLFKIAEKLGIPMEILARYNGLTYTNQLYTKQVLYIPYRFRYPQIYQVKAGDTIYKIAEYFEISVEEITKFNRLETELIYIGQQLKIPVLKPTAPPENPQYGKKYPGILYYKGITYSRKIALTFDDGPDSYYTERILEVLKEHGIKATFFLIGNNIENYPDVVKKIVEDGHVIASHTWSHPNLGKANEEQIISEIKNTENIVENYTGEKMRLLRPPWGVVSDDVLRLAQDMDYKVVNWNVDSNDWSDQNIDQILINTIPDINDDAIILFHSAGGRNQNLDATVNVLLELIETLKMNGYTFVTVDEIINTLPYKI